ncbi:hypothetical protein PPMP20_07205 [Paraburkholderia phymatum]|uniref:Serine aminopeptidase S33 domain-containing protein n=1 Tax=Paraburkholderia phymatum (strain DSM 17167 / CIP 108236 / LMG 21445 / STM815) TaxID=391038 RepID=B2JID2_PARP8|nr:hypothetical protein [Paraburkholderia phymatum]ACC70526.1 conserved hypothetical protein [Paraburkholderia phymatum STM815]
MSAFAVRFIYRLFGLLAMLAVLRPAGAMASEQVIDVPLAQGASIAYLLTQQDGSQPRSILVMMPGSTGNLELSQQPGGAIHLRERNNFLIRARHLFVDNQFATAIVDAPSDQSGGYSDAFRASARAAQDLAQVAADLRKRFPKARLVLVGTSRGTISTAYAGRALPDVWDAVVHTSTLSSPARGQATPMIGFDYGAISARQLFVHHADDGCFLCSYEALRRIAESRQYALITVHGGDARGEPCGALSHHGFYGRDEAVVAAIKAWISGQPWQDDVG